VAMRRRMDLLAIFSGSSGTTDIHKIIASSPTIRRNCLMQKEESELLPLLEAVQIATGRQFYRKTVHAWRRSGKLKAAKIGQQWFCTVRNVREMVTRETEAARNQQASA